MFEKKKEVQYCNTNAVSAKLHVEDNDCHCFCASI
uniref:Uncharacterized protein n=1 Tax=Anguilla anguilla TaxID=7936 RepID=A0A0E9V261_ANGAN